MGAIALWRWVLLRMLASPWLGILVLALLAKSLLLQGLSPLLLSRSAAEVGLKWVFPAGLVGVLHGLATLSRGERFLARLDPKTRFRGELGALLAASLYLQLPTLAGLMLAGVVPLDVGRALPAILTADLHLSAIALLLLSIRSSDAVRSSLLLAAAWLLPALSTGDEPLVHVSALFDAGAVLRSPVGPFALAPAAALVLAACLLRATPPRPVSG